MVESFGFFFLMTAIQRFKVFYCKKGMTGLVRMLMVRARDLEIDKDSGVSSPSLGCCIVTSLWLILAMH